MFLTEIWKCSLEIGNAGRVIANWFRHYCDHHAVSPSVLNSLQNEVTGLGTAEKEEDRAARLFREKVEELEMELWKRAGRPEGGPVQFRAVAREQLSRALRGRGGRLMANMTDARLSALLADLTSLPDETEWVEWKHDYTPKEIGPYIAEYLSALANSAALHSKETAYLVWGIEDGTRNVVGTKFKPRKAKQGNEELENWLMRSLHPQVNFKIHEFSHKGKPVVLFEIPRAHPRPRPVRQRGVHPGREPQEEAQGLPHEGSANSGRRSSRPRLSRESPSPVSGRRRCWRCWTFRVRSTCSRSLCPPTRRVS